MEMERSFRPSLERGKGGGKGEGGGAQTPWRHVGGIARDTFIKDTSQKKKIVPYVRLNPSLLGLHSALVERIRMLLGQNSAFFFLFFFWLLERCEMSPSSGGGWLNQAKEELINE